MSVIVDHVSRGICRILINRPAKRNAINFETLCRLKSALKNFEDDESYQIAILAGEGGNFCAGYDLNEMIDPINYMPQIDNIDRLLWPLGSKLSEKKLTIAAIDGCAAGFGYELALKCDFRIAERDARMGFLNRRFGIPIMNGGSIILPKLVGQARAMELIATGKAQLAPEALHHGLLVVISDVGCAQGRAMNFARSIVKFNQSALMNDLRQFKSDSQMDDIESLLKERTRSLEFLKSCGPLEVAGGFLKGDCCRHGSFNLGTLIKPDPEVTL